MPKSELKNHRGAVTPERRKQIITAINRSNVSGKGAAFLWDKENGREWSVRPRTVKTQAACWSDFSRAFFQARGVNSATVRFVARGRRSKMSFKYACGSTPCIRQLAIKV